MPLTTSFTVAAVLATGMYLGGAALPAIREDLALGLGSTATIASFPWGAFVVGALLALRVAPDARRG